MKKLLLIFVILLQILNFNAIPLIFGEINGSSKLIHSEHLTKTGSTIEALSMEKIIEVREIIQGIKLDIVSGLSTIIDGGIGCKTVKILSTGFGSAIPIDTKVEIYANGSGLNKFSIAVLSLCGFISYVMA